MTKEETKAILKVLRAGYPNFYKGLTKDEATNIINLWSTMFASDHPSIVTEAVKALMCILVYPPTIADVKAQIRHITEPDKMTELEAWGLVLKAIGDSGYHSEERFAVLPPIIQKLVGSHNQLKEWGMMESETVNSVVQSNFMRSYKDKQKQVDSYKALPDSTKQMIEGLSRKMELGEGT